MALNDPHVEKIFLTLMCRFFKTNYVHNLEVLYRAVPEITRKLPHKTFQQYEEYDIFTKLISSRATFANFRRFINHPHVDYYKGPNTVHIIREYYNEFGNVQEPDQWSTFREEGLPIYGLFKFIFITAECASFVHEPEENEFRNIPIRDSDSDNDGFTDIYSDEDREFDEEEEIEEGEEDQEMDVISSCDSYAGF